MVFRRRWVWCIASLLIMVLFLLSACKTAYITITPQADTTKSNDGIEETAEPSRTETVLATETEIRAEATKATRADIEGTETEVNPLTPEPIEGSFQTSDGIILSGTFYPARTVNAPLIILFHWARGDQSEWAAIAPWLQNRGLRPNLDMNGQPWLDANWFPAMPEEVSFNVFSFTFRGCEGGCQIFDREGWLLDIEAAMAYVINLEYVDHSRVAMIGASIGGDGAAYACHVYNSNYGGCQGALSFSPGGYLTFTYRQEVDNLASQSPSTPAWCIYSVGDRASAQACEAASGEAYQAIAYTDNAHGLAMLEPEREPDIMNFILRFLSEIGLSRPFSSMPAELQAHMTFEVLNVFPHDPQAFTQGLIFHEGYLYESTGLYGKSSLRKVILETGEVIQRFDLEKEYFAEGLTLWGDQFVQLTWLERIGFVYNQEDFSLIGSFTYDSEGWGLTHDGERLIMSDGSSKLYFIDPDTFQVTEIINVTYQGEDVRKLNELEFIDGEVFANIYMTDDIIRIDPATGEVLGWISLSGLLPDEDRTPQTGVLNGIAYDDVQDRLFVTGKLWPKVYEIRLVPAQ